MRKIEQSVLRHAHSLHSCDATRNRHPTRVEGIWPAVTFGSKRSDGLLAPTSHLYQARVKVGPRPPPLPGRRQPGQHKANTTSAAKEDQLGNREAGRIFPGQLPALDAWVPPWRDQPAPASPRGTARSTTLGVALVTAHPRTCDAVARLLGCDDPWEAAAPARSGMPLLDRFPATAQALEPLLLTV